MTKLIYFFYHFFIIFTLIASITSCSPPKSIQPKTFETTQNSKVVFGVGLRNITEKYINKLSIKSIVVSGLKGLTSIDPSLTVNLDQTNIHLSYKNEQFKSWRITEYKLVEEWAQTMDDAVLFAKDYSHNIQSISQEKIFEAIFDGILSNLDSFSRYADAKQAAINRAKREGYVGIGVKFQIENNIVKITEIVANSPAAKANLKLGDVITHIDNLSVNGLSDFVLNSNLRGPNMTDVRLKIKRGQMPSITKLLTRARIISTSVTEKHSGRILYFKISNFNQNTAHSFAEKLSLALERTKPTAKGIILDLRGNPGGLLKQSVKVADIFLNKGQIVSTTGRHQESLNQYIAGGRDLSGGLPIIVLINGQSASAAEIVAAALQDQNRAVIIGTSSFGKGTVQTVIRLPNGGEITLTWSKFIAPSGYSMNGLGVRPVICTSKEVGEVDKQIKKTVLLKNELKTIFRFWRAPGNHHINQRNNLRNSCPPNRRNSHVDIQLAKHILAEPKYYTKTLELSSNHD